MIAHSLIKLPSDTKDFDKELERLGYWDPVDIDESWMEISEAELEQMLQERSAPTAKKSSSANDENPLGSLVDRLQQFIVTQQSGLDGVEVDENNSENNSDNDSDDFRFHFNRLLKSVLPKLVANLRYFSSHFFLIQQLNFSKRMIYYYNYTISTISSSF